MKKVILVMAVAVFFAFAGIVMATPPTNAPIEGFKITTDTNIVAVGIVKESENFTWHWNNTASAGVANSNGIQPAANKAGALGEDETEARIRYTEEFNSMNTLSAATVPTSFNKVFVADSHPSDMPNMTVDKVIGYTSDGAAGSVADFSDKVAMEVVSAGGNQAGGFAGIFVLCPWIGADVKKLPATNEGVAMGSAFNIPNMMSNGAFGSISANIESDVELTSNVQMGYEIMATGAGLINAEMLAKLYEGTEAASSSLGVNTTPLQSFATYSEKAEANGIFAPFFKKMNYASKFTAPSPISEIVDQILP